MITVHIWQGLYGHASLEITDNPQLNNTYMSFHPSDESSKLSAVFGTIVTPVKSYQADIERMGQHISDQKWDKSKGPKIKPHTNFVNLSGLNEELMFKYWQKLLDEQEKYFLFSQNCSTVVAKCLIIAWLGRSENEKGDIFSEAIINNEARRHKSWAYKSERKFRGAHTWVEHTYEYENNTANRPHLRKLPEFVAGGLAIMGYATMFFSIPAALTLWAGAFIGSKVLDQIEKSVWDPKEVHGLALEFQETLWKKR